MGCRAVDFGVNIDAHIDMRQHKGEVAGASNRGVTKWLDGMDNLAIYRGNARFEGSE